MQTTKNGANMSNRELASLLKQAVEKMGMEEEPNTNGWATPQPTKSDAPFLGVSVPIKVETPRGSARCYLSLPPDVAASPETLVNAIKQLLDMGIPVDLYQAKQDGGWSRNGNGWNNNNNGGGNGYRNGGGYNGGGYNNGGNGGYRRGGW